MGKTDKSTGFLSRLRRTWGVVQRYLNGDGKTSSRYVRRLAPLQELEDRRLLSVTPVGAEYRVNTYTQGAQQTFANTPQSVAMNPANGNYVVVWSSQGQNGGSGFDVYFQRYNAAGTAQGSATLVDTPVNGVNQQFANVAMNSSGNFVVTWSSQQGGNWNIYARQYNAAGVAQGAAILVDTPVSHDQEYSSVAMNSSGNFVVTWSGDQSGNWQIYDNVFNQNGVSSGGPVQITNAGTDQMFPEVAMNGAGDFVVTWVGYQSGSNWNVNAEMFGSNNQPVGTVSQLNTTVTADSFPAIAMDAAGNYTITWSGDSSGTENTYARSFLSSGAPNGAPFHVGPTIAQPQAYSSVAFAGNGDPIITWSSDNQDGSGWGVYAQQFTTAGIPVGSELQVNTYTTGDQEYSSIASAANGKFTIVWTSNNQDGSGFGVYGQNFTTGISPGINVTGSTFLVSEDNSVVRVNSLTGAVIATYPTGLANNGAVFGPDGTLYAADYNNNQIDHYSAAGVLLSSFGSGHLSEPQGVTFGPDGNLYVTNVNNTVDKFSPTGTFLGTFITAGSGGLSNAKDIVWGPDGNAYVSSFYNSEVLEYNGTTGAFIKVFATGSGGFEQIIFGPNGNLYAASYGDGAIYQYSGTNGASLGAFASGPLLADAYGLSFDPDGNLDVAVRSSGTILTYNGTTGAFLGDLDNGLTNPAYLTATTSLVTADNGTTAAFTIALTSEPLAPVTINLGMTVAGQGSLSESSLTFNAGNWNVPQTVTVTGLDDYSVGGIQTYQITGTTTSADGNYNGMAMTPVAVTNYQFDTAGVKVTGSTFLVSEDNKNVRINSLTGAVVATYPTGVLADGSVFGSDGSLYVSDYVNNQILYYNTAGALVASFGSSELSDPQGLAFGADGNLYVANGSGAVDKFSPTGTFLGTFIAAGSGGLINAKAIAWGSDGNAYVSSYTNSEVLEFNGTTGAFISVFATGSGGFEGLTFGPDGNLFVASYGDNAVYQYSGTDGAALGVFASGPQLVGPFGLSFDTNGNLDVTTASSPGTIQTYNGTTGAFLGNLVTGLTDPEYLTPTTSLVTSDTGTTATFIVSLISKPVAPVTIDLSMSQAGQGSLSRTSLVFNASNWNVAQTVTVTGLNDYIADGNQTYQITGTVSSTDPNYNGLAMTPVTVTNINTNVAGLTVTPTSLTTTDTGTSASFRVTLTSKPIGPVTINLSASETGQGSLSQSSLIFNPGNWNVAQTVTVTGLNDHIVDGNQSYQIAGTATSTDADYNNMTMTPVGVTNINTNVAGFTVLPTSIQTSMAGASSSFSVLLTSEPLAPVTIDLASDDPGEGTLSTNTLTFDAGNWNVAQTVTVTGDNDPLAGANVTYQITGVATSNDANYNNMAITPVTVTNVDTTFPGFIVNPTTLMTSQSGTSASFTVTLATLPQYPVTVNLTNSDPAEGSLSRSSLTFSQLNWDAPQTVTVTGLDDHIADGNQTYQITGAVTSQDLTYNNMAITPVTVTNINTNVAGLTVTPTSLTTTDTGTSASFRVTLTSKPMSPVTINLSASEAGQSTLSQSSLIFNAGNWNVAQTVTVTGLNDHIVDGNQSYQITGTATSTDANYNNMAMTPVDVTNINTNVAGFTVLPTSIQTSMAGASSSFSVLLTSEPVAPVTINLASNDPGEGTLSTNTLTFNAGNWNVAQTVTVTGENDPLAGDNVTYQITGVATSNDANFNNLAITPVTVTNVGTTLSGFIVSPTTLTTADTGTSASFKVALTSEPFTPVTINLSTSAPGQGSLLQTSLIFNSGNWNIAQTVTVTGLNDYIAEGNQTYQITGMATSADANYNNKATTPVSVTNINTNVAGFTVTPASIQTSMAGASSSFSVHLTSEPLAPVTIDLASNHPSEGSLSVNTLTFSARNWNVAQFVTLTGQNDPLAGANVTYRITGVASSGDAHYEGLAVTPVSVTNLDPYKSATSMPVSVTDIESQATPPMTHETSPAMAPSIPPIVLSTATPSFPALSVTSDDAVGANPIVSPAHSVNTALLLSSVLSKARPINGLSENEYTNSMTQIAEFGANRTTPVLFVTPRSDWQPAPDESQTALLEEFPFDSFLSQFSLSPAMLSQTPTAQDDELLDVLSDDGERMPWRESDLETSALIGTAIVAGSGYVLVNSRLGLWLLGLMSARPVWKQFDPMEVLYAWEDDGRKQAAVDGEDEESLMSLVD